MSIQKLLDEMWQDYISMNPQAKNIYDLFTNEGEIVVNDHIALRTFNIPEIGVDKIAKPFIDAGYVEKGQYNFEAKKLYAKHWEHADESLPKIFISELIIEEFDEEIQSLIKSLVAQVEKEKIDKDNFCYSGRPWACSLEIFNKLRSETEYGAWLAAWGFRANHFTVFINKMKKYNDIRKLNQLIESNGFKLNDSGGIIKGSPEVFLEQSSTLANNVEVDFSDGRLSIPGCYYEFAQRYVDSTGSLYKGFVAKSADKIFESTDRGQ